MKSPTTESRKKMLNSQGQGSTPCAACKLLRRRCAQECPFSPYFSPQEPQKFACVHKIFGASNVSKMLMEVPENQRADAASSLVYEANARIRDPVYGCMGAISALQQQAQALQAELNAVRMEINRYRQHENSPTNGTLTTTASATALVSGYQELVQDRGRASDTRSSKPSTTDVHTTVHSPSSTVATSESKDRTYWSPIT